MLFELSTQSGEPEELPRPVITIFELVVLLVAKVTLSPPVRVKVEAALAAKLPLAVKVLAKAPVPVTARLPPTDSLPVIEAEFRVARAEVVRVEREVLPVTASVELRVVAPVTPSVPPTVTLPVRVESRSTVKFPLNCAFPLLSKVAPLPPVGEYPPLMLAVPAERLVKCPVDAESAPMAVPLMPVEVVLKLLEVKVKLLLPALITELPRLVILREPPDEVSDNAPPLWVRPLEAVSRPDEVIVPPLAVEILPLVTTVPSAVTEKLVTPFDWSARRVLAGELVSLITRAVAVPSLLIVKLEGVEVAARLKTMFLLSAVVMVLPPA